MKNVLTTITKIDVSYIEDEDKVMKTIQKIWVVANYFYKDDDWLVPVTRLIRRSDNRAVDCSTLTEEEANSDRYRFVTAGLGAVLISVKALKKIGRPYFRTQSVVPKHLGEDSYFYQECQSLGIPIWLALDVPVLHYGNGRFYGKREHVERVVPSLRM